MKAREVKRAKLVAKYAEKRAALKKIIATTNDPIEAYEEEIKDIEEVGKAEREQNKADAEAAAKAREEARAEAKAAKEQAKAEAESEKEE